MRKVLTVLIMALAMSQPAVAVMDTGIAGIQSITPVDTRCSLSAGAPLVDYGTQSRWQLQDVAGGNEVTPGKRTVMLSVVCPYSQTMRLSLRGDRATNGNLRYGDRGSINIQLLDAQLDGQAVQIAFTTSDGVISSAPEPRLWLQPGNDFSAVQNGQLAKGKSFNAHLEIEPVMPENATRVSSQLISESLLVLELAR